MVRMRRRRGVNSKNIEEVEFYNLVGLGISSEQKKQTRMHSQVSTRQPGEEAGGEEEHWVLSKWR